MMRSISAAPGSLFGHITSRLATNPRGMVLLPGENRVFPVRLEIVAMQKDLCRCRFTEIHEEAENLLHFYILDLQKRKIRQNSGLH